MSKRPTDHLEPAAKKRGNERQLTKDDPSDDDEEPVLAEGFAKASEEVMKTRRIVRPKRAGGLSSSQATGGAANPFAGVSLAGPSTNPFAGVNLTAAPQTNPFAQVTLSKTVGQSAEPAKDAPTDSAKPQPASTGGAVAGSANTVDVASSASGPADNAAEATTSAAQSEGIRPDAASVTAQGSVNAEAAASQTAAPVDFSSFSSANKQQSPFAVTAGGGKAAFGDSSNGLTFGSATGGFGAIGKSAGSFGALSQSNDKSQDNEGFSFKPSNTSPAGSSDGGKETAASAAASPSTSPVQSALPQEQQRHTGEEGETVLYDAEGTLFQFDDQDTKTWRERGRGELRVNKAPNGQARLVMRQRGNFRLLLNANLWPQMPVSMMDGNKGVTFPCVNHAGSDENDGDAANASGEVAKKLLKLSSFAFRKKAVHKLEELLQVLQRESSGDARSPDATSAV